MKRIEIFDPAMCCPTGLCGPNINPDLMRIAAVLETLKRQGIVVERHNLRDEPPQALDGLMTLGKGKALKTVTFMKTVIKLGEWINYQ